MVLKGNLEVGEYLHSLIGGDAKKLRRYLDCLLKSDQLDDVEKGMLIHALGDSYAHSYTDWTAWRGSPKQGGPNPNYGKEVLYAPPFGHLFSGHMPDYIASKPGVYGNYVDQLYGTLSSINNGAPTHPEWIAGLKTAAGDLSKPSFIPDFFKGKGQNNDEVGVVRNLPGGYASSLHNYNPDDRDNPTIPGKGKEIPFRNRLIEKIKNGVKGCCPNN